MSNYEKLKNDDLKKILTDRGLPTTGKKADFVSRLVEHDATQSSTPATTKDPKVNQQRPAPAASETKVTNDGTSKTEEPNTKAKGEPTTTTPSTSTTQPTQEQVKSNDDREAKLAARAARFGIPKDEEEERRKARAARFGTSEAASTATTVPEDKALSQPRPKKEGQPPKKGQQTAAATAAATGKKESEVQKRKVSVLDDPVEAEKARKRALKFGTAGVSAPAVEGKELPPAAEVASTTS
ncbi:protein of unknown function [Taphrina deformans PYCC 5710]|uniref:SAP domain-containing protein n=1 Tax=Taphrina deformans (strain PYCC 5710 / ATCC 11124 / CBS 356.35 / IMI 108563 / JCM 9778 / NBRC 8474) TaxID=1097556 RepID=R4XNJ3_TAPDE|nr:protein of unknown function [Taphrina deformans PYCC 5710]|eukprot:CCG84814.1 protein of unknown function [Taphrina deformans PYCC 5710]